MTLPVWPATVPYKPEPEGFQPIERALPPVATEFEGGNERQRRRPGDDVGMMGQTIVMTGAQFDTFTTWWKGTLGLGTARFTATVWLGTAYGSRTCQFTKDGKPKDAYYGYDKVSVAMKLRVYGI